jgi:hypothetical protein
MIKIPSNWYSIPGYSNKSRWNIKRTVVTLPVKYINLNDIGLYVGVDDNEFHHWILNADKTILSNEILNILKGQILIIENNENNINNNSNAYTLINYGIIMNAGIISVNKNYKDYFINNGKIQNINSGNFLLF